MEKKFKVTAGFDGYVDRIMRVVRNYDENKKDYFENILQFSSALGLMAGKSGDLELVTEDVRLGGNAPLTAYALAKLGASVTLVGTTDHDVFKNHHHHNVTKISYGAPGDTLALEFDDGKIMMADVTDMCRSMKAVISNSKMMREITDAYMSSDLCVFANWSCLPETHDLWEAILAKIKQRRDNPIIFMDLADFTKRSVCDVKKLVGLIKSLEGFEIYLGLNEKETFMLAERLGFMKSDIQEAAAYIYKTAGCSVITHGVGYCVYADGLVQLKLDAKVAKSPKILTGAGDNFNSAWCYAIMQEFDKLKAMEFANQFVYDFVTGKE